ncbi:MAG: rhamnogalacturonan acetylesterase [Gammaproteobacteria bacterium]|nr:rhamnogalacturonan acetylesterase [Gammaproteobacteria bacterium]
MKILMMGDSTMKKNNFYSYPQFGWGQGLELFTKEDIAIYNYAENGRSTKSFIDEGRFDKLLSNLEKGDYVICSFGHNDEKIQDPLRYTDPFGTYQENLEYFRRKVTEKGGHIVFATSITRHKFIGSKCVNSHGDYPKAMLEYARKANVTCIDLNKLSIDYYNEVGEEASKKFHMIFKANKYPNYIDGKDDHSHLMIDGAILMARLFVEAISKTNDPIKECFIDTNLKNQIDFKMLID